MTISLGTPITHAGKIVDRVSVRLPIDRYVLHDRPRHTPQLHWNVAIHTGLPLEVVAHLTGDDANLIVNEINRLNDAPDAVLCRQEIERELALVARLRDEAEALVKAASNPAWPWPAPWPAK
jgi:hypothetical protein